MPGIPQSSCVLVYPQQSCHPLTPEKKRENSATPCLFWSYLNCSFSQPPTLFFKKVVIMSPYTGYRPLENDESSSSIESCHACHSAPRRCTWRGKRNATISSTLLILSNLLTWFFSSQMLYDSPQPKIDPRTPYGMSFTPVDTRIVLLIFPPSSPKPI